MLQSISVNILLSPLKIQIHRFYSCQEFQLPPASINAAISFLSSLHSMNQWDAIVHHHQYLRLIDMNPNDPCSRILPTTSCNSKSNNLCSDKFNDRSWLSTAVHQQAVHFQQSTEWHDYNRSLPIACLQTYSQPLILHVSGIVPNSQSWHLLARNACLNNHPMHLKQQLVDLDLVRRNANDNAWCHISGTTTSSSFKACEVEQIGDTVGRLPRLPYGLCSTLYGQALQRHLKVAFNVSGFLNGFPINRQRLKVLVKFGWTDQPQEWKLNMH